MSLPIIPKQPSIEIINIEIFNKEYTELFKPINEKTKISTKKRIRDAKTFGYDHNNIPTPRLNEHIHMRGISLPKTPIPSKTAFTKIQTLVKKQ
jgi:hypothetical protein